MLKININEELLFNLFGDISGKSDIKGAIFLINELFKNLIQVIKYYNDLKKNKNQTEEMINKDIVNYIVNQWEDARSYLQTLIARLNKTINYSEIRPFLFYYSSMVEFNYIFSCRYMEIIRKNDNPKKLDEKLAPKILIDPNGFEIFNDFVINHYSVMLEDNDLLYFEKINSILYEINNINSIIMNLFKKNIVFEN